VILKLFSKGAGLFKTAMMMLFQIIQNEFFALQEEYIKTIDPVIRFLQGKIQPNLPRRLFA
jgi:P2-related tail formation protein